jgi:hypothetical protein
MLLLDAIAPQKILREVQLLQVAAKLSSISSAVCATVQASEEVWADLAARV